jgi:hypothetical protein
MRNHSFVLSAPGVIIRPAGEPLPLRNDEQRAALDRHQENHDEDSPCPTT